MSRLNMMQYCASVSDSLSLWRLFTAVETTDICESIQNNDLTTLRTLLAKSPEYSTSQLISGKTPLICAFAHNNLEAVRLLLQHGADINEEVEHCNQMSDGRYTLEFGPVMLSVNSAEVLEVLLESLTKPIKLCSRLWHKFYTLAINKRSETLLSLLIAKCHLDDGLTETEQLMLTYNVLIEAVENGIETVINHLLDVNKDRLQALLRIAAANKSNAQVVQLCKLLLERGAGVDSSMLFKADIDLQAILLESVKSKVHVEPTYWRNLCSSVISDRKSEQYLLSLITKCEWVSQTQNSDYGPEKLLLLAVERDWQEATKQLLDLGANPNCTFLSVSSILLETRGPLYVAASNKLVSLCKLLVSRGALLNSSDHKRDPMIQAILNGSVDAAETLLSLGSRCKCNERVRLENNVGCLKAGRNVPSPQKITNGTLLHHAVTLGDLPIVEFMINRCRADIETVDSNGNTALLLAANRLSPDIVEFLLETYQERRLNAVKYMAQKNRSRGTALFHAINAIKAVETEYLECAELKIIESFVKRNVNLMNESNVTHVRALVVAIRCNQGGLIRDMVRCGLPKQLLSASCDSPVCYSTPVEEAVENDSWNCVEALITLGASFPSEKRLGKPFLHYIIDKYISDEDFLPILKALDGKIDWNAISGLRESYTNRGSSVSEGSILHVVIRRNCNIDVIKYCLAKCIQSINVTIYDEEENGILKVAHGINERNKKLTVCEMLVEAGARLPNSMLNTYFPKANYAERKFAEMLVIAGCDIDVG